MKPATQSLIAFAESLQPQSVLQQLAPIFSRSLRASRIGIACTSSGTEHFQNIALWDEHKPELQPGSVFSSVGAAATWVNNFACPLMGQNIADMHGYPATQAYLVREQFRSNILVPLDLGAYGRCVMYALARSADAFDNTVLAVSLRIRDILEPSLCAFYATSEYAEGRTEDKQLHSETSLATNPPSLSLDDVMRQHILQALAVSNWIIEGPRGAAQSLKILPSTLRNRMRKLKIQREPYN
jgi:hypothetical protein